MFRATTPVYLGRAKRELTLAWTAEGGCPHMFGNISVTKQSKRDGPRELTLSEH